MHPVTEMLNASARKAVAVNCDVNCLRIAVTELAKIVERLLPEPEPPMPTPEDLAAMEAAGIESFDEAHAKVFGKRVDARQVAQRGAWWTAQGSGSTVGAKVTESRVNVQHPTVARIKFANGGIVISGPRGAGGGSDPRLAELRLQHNAAMDSKNDLIRELEARIANQRKELDHLNNGRSLRNKELEARIAELELLTKAPASAIDQLRGELTGKLTDFLLKSA